MHLAILVGACILLAVAPVLIALHYRPRPAAAAAATRGLVVAHLRVTQAQRIVTLAEEPLLRPYAARIPFNERPAPGVFVTPEQATMWLRAELGAMGDPAFANVLSAPGLCRRLAKHHTPEARNTFDAARRVLLTEGIINE